MALRSDSGGNCWRSLVRLLSATWCGSLTPLRLSDNSRSLVLYLVIIHILVNGLTAMYTYQNISTYEGTQKRVRRVPEAPRSLIQVCSAHTCSE